MAKTGHVEFFVESSNAEGKELRGVMRSGYLALLAALFLAGPAAVSVRAQAPIEVSGFYSLNRAPRGRVVQAAIVMQIPDGYHVNANRPLSKYAIPTEVKIEAPAGVRVGPVIYPRAVVRRFSFSKDQIAVYEGRTVMRFNVTIPASFRGDRIELRARVRYQACTNEVCYPPRTKEVVMPIEVVNANERVERINTNIFGGRGRRG
ncbi:Disulphide bond corrector protein DsbC [Pyrinomonas methylaliphatogenes]|uniref:Disulphide bond corrector protein DsbC n=2 Tax=Pyrinomonas methylaliphatogenes TaxID=454194 RepID=A0A0B6WW78_9BACT|nr:Disulphide bond corrector protein DsbC [Pyrinomonas methylaliphatogenes]